MPTVRTHELATRRVLIPIRSLTVPTPPSCSLPKLLHFNSFKSLLLLKSSIPTSPPGRKLWHQNLIPEKGSQQH
ncbi:hypothetical protein Hanom_Chr12g01139341 [Helianthus anomalus]